jgi:hypothetical protein
VTLIARQENPALEPFQNEARQACTTPCQTAQGSHEHRVLGPRGCWIIETINRESAKQGELQEDRFKIYDFDLPDSARDTVTIELQRACKKESQSCGISIRVRRRT